MTPTGEACPLCGAPLRPEQEWCLGCGAAARTRLAASPNWRRPLAAVAVLVLLCLGVIAASLVDLAGGSNATPASVITTPVAASAPAAVAQPSAPAGAVPGTGTFGAAPNGTAAAPRTTPATPASPHPTQLPRVSLPATRGDKRSRGGSFATRIEERLHRLGLSSGVK